MAVQEQHYLNLQGLQTYDDLIKINKLGNFTTATDVAVGGVTYHTFWEVAPTASNQVWGVAVHPTDGTLIKVFNNQGTYSVIPYDGKELTQAQYNALSTQEKNNGTYYITDAGSSGSGFPAVDFIFSTVADMNTAISGGTVPNNATCYVTGTSEIYKVISGTATPFGGGSNPNVLLKDGSIPADNFTIGTRATGSTVGTRSSVQGQTCTASGINSHAEGKSTQATDHCAHAEGLEGQATGEASHVEGGALIASGRFSHAEGNYTSATAASAHAEGASTTASGQCSHAEGYGTTACSYYTHAEGYGATAGNSTTPANGQYAHAEGRNTVSSGLASHAEGYETTSTGQGSHSEGSYSDATGNHSHAEGNDTTAAAYCSHAEGSATTVYGSGSHVEGAYSYIGEATTDKISICHVEGDHSYIKNASDKDVTGCHVEGYYCNINIPDSNTDTLCGIHVEGYTTTASGEAAHAEGRATYAKAKYSHAEGYDTKAHSNYAHAEGWSTNAGNSTTPANGNAAHAEGNNTTASGAGSHAEGLSTTASGSYAHTEGTSTTANGTNSHAEGSNTIASIGAQHVSGQYNVSNSTSGNYFIIGNGTNNGRSNCFRVYTSAVYGNGAYNSSGADYAEYFEWLDSNINEEDRAGRFVTLDGDKIRLANAEDDYILGIVSGNASVIGDSHDDQWSQMYERDIFGRFIFEDAEIPAITQEIDGEEVVIEPAHIEHRLKLNPAYDNTQTYIPRSERPEWDAVGMVGKLVALDDGTCEVNGYCAPSDDGIATKVTKSKYRVMKRLDANHIQVVIL